MQVQKQRKTIDIPPGEEETKRGFVWSREVLYVFAAAAIIGWLAYDYVKEHAVLKPKVNHEIIQKDIGLQNPPYLPDISGFTVENIAAKVPPPIAGKIVFDKISDYPEFSEFMEDQAPQKLRLAQRRVNPRAIIVKSGHYTWSMLVAEIAKIDPDGQLIQKIEPNIYVVRVPVGVLIGASLTISDKDAAEIRLSKQGNSFLVNAGELFILRTTVKGWDEEKQKNSPYIDKKDFRPFITSWSGGELFIAGSLIESLGYLSGKSYGLSYSACSACHKVNPFLPPATGALVGNKFDDMYYGFYSYEAEDVAIIGNEYVDNIVYGIDPHDRSKRLIIAENKAHGTIYKHGIIISREVNDSWLFNNHSYNNKGSGMMIDRISVNNVIANNILEHNEQDGLTFFESQDNVMWNNTIRFNKRNGVLIRNSWNIRMYGDTIQMNDGVAVEAYASSLTGVELHRDFELDPYTMKADVVMYGASIKSSGSSIFKMDKTDFIELSNLKLWAGTDLFSSRWAYDRRDILKNIDKPGTVVRVDIGFKSTDTPKFPTKHE